MRKRFVIYALSAFFVIAAAPVICVGASDKEEKIPAEGTEMISDGEPAEAYEVNETVAGEPENDDAGTVAQEEERTEDDAAETGQKPEEETDILGDEAGNHVPVIEDELFRDEEVHNRLEMTVADFFEKDISWETGRMEADNEAPVQEKGFVKTDNGTVYYDENGSAVTGEKKIDGYWYYFDEATGLMHKGYRTKDGNQLYYDNEGHQVFGAYKGKKYWYYFDTATGARLTGWRTSGKNKYYYNDAGRMVTGERKIDGYSYYFNPKTGLMQTGYRTKGKNQLYYNSRGRQIFGAYKGKKYWYYFDTATGARLTGWRTSGKNKYYYNINGRMATGVKKIGKYWYFFNKKSGVMHKGLRKSGKDTYYYDSKGHLARGAHKINGKWYYFESNGKRTTSQAKILAIKVLDKYGWSLRNAFNYSARRLRYVSTGRPPKGKSHADWYATRGFKNKSGNCYVMAATFVQMARVMGYSTYLVEGSVPSISGGYTPHGWCEIMVKGTKYVCDPDFTHETGRNGYMIRYRQPGTWVYVGYRRVK